MASTSTASPRFFTHDDDAYAELLDTAGHIDISDCASDSGVLHLVTQAVPLSDGPLDTATATALLVDGELSVGDIIDAVVTATTAAVERYDEVVIDDLFDVLPKVGIREDRVPLRSIERLADAAARSRATIRATSRWSCPSARTLQPFIDRGVTATLDA